MRFVIGKKGTMSPLCFMPDGTLVCYQYGYIVLLKDSAEINRFKLPFNFFEKYIGRCKLAYRLFRLGVRAAISIDNENLIISIGNVLLDFNIITGNVSNPFFCGKGVRPLILTRVKDIKGFDDCIVFGGYLGNMNKFPVEIYRRRIDKWEVAYTFPQGTINHVHNIVADPYRNCLWAFTGDFEEASAIWRIKDNFKDIKRVVCNDQKYRGCVAYALPEGLLYATDAPFADDYICFFNTITLKCEELFPIDGSCIYGCQWKDKFVFSSTVEGDGRNMSRIEFFFGKKRGAGIKDNYVHMYIGNLKEGFKEIYNEEKDGMPYYTFQFGAFKFPYGVNNTDTLYFQPIATKKNDLCLMIYKGKHPKVF